MKKVKISFIIGLIFAILVSSFSGFARECNNIRSSVFRLHILANSDIVADQQLKIKVRDAILKNTKDIFNEQSTLAQAKINATNNIDKIKIIAQNEINTNGYDYKVNAEVTNMFFNTRYYDNLTMPAGNYDALRITIGNADGKNWWCVLYPPICLPAATKKVEIEQTLNQKQVDIVKSNRKIEVRFKAVEIYEKIKQMIK